MYKEILSFVKNIFFASVMYEATSLEELPQKLCPEKKRRKITRRITTIIALKI